MIHACPEWRSEWSGEWHRECLAASGLLADAAGAPLRPGGAALSEALLEVAAFAPGGRVLDIGCGRGESLERLARRGLWGIGVDRSAPTLAAARRSGMALVRADGMALPFADAAFDGVLAECSLSVMADRARALAEWRRVLRPGGRLALSDVTLRAPAAPRRGGIADRASVLAGLVATGFAVDVWEDRSDVLKAWVAGFLFRYGSLDALGNEALSNHGADGGIGGSKVGYFLLTATRP